MMVIFVASFFCVLNICLWCVFFIKFRKLFSTEDIIASTREQIENLISDLNNNTSRDIQVIEDRIKQLKASVAEADRHIELAKRELENQKAQLSYQQKIDAVLQKNPPHTPQVRAADRYMRNMQNQPPYSDISAGLQSANRYELTDEGNRHAHAKVQQGDLFEQADADRNQITSNAGTTFTIESDGSSYASVPVIGGNVSYADDPVQPQKKFGELVRDLYMAGHSVDEIARELNTSTTEVQMSLEMGGF